MQLLYGIQVFVVNMDLNEAKYDQLGVNKTWLCKSFDTHMLNYAFIKW